MAEPHPEIVCGPVAADSRRTIAVHEAGHVVVGLRHGLKLLSTDILRDGEGGFGHTHFAPQGWFRPVPGRLRKSEREFAERVLTTFLAGFAAESRLRPDGADPEGSGYDLERSVVDWLEYLASTPGERQALIDVHLERAQQELAKPEVWRAVEAVSEALLARNRLEADEAEHLVASASEP